MMSPANHSGVVSLGAALVSRRWNSWRQPWISPKASGTGCGAGERNIKEIIGYKKRSVGATRGIAGKGASGIQACSVRPASEASDPSRILTDNLRDGFRLPAPLLARLRRMGAAPSLES